MKFVDLNRLLQSKPSIALIGASDDPNKYGNIILRDLLHRKFQVFPVNPTKETLEGQKVYPNLESLVKLHRPELLVYVIPPARTLGSLEEAHRLGLKKVWIQPGAGDGKVEEFLEAKNFEYVMNACVMVMG